MANMVLCSLNTAVSSVGFSCTNFALQIQRLYSFLYLQCILDTCSMNGICNLKSIICTQPPEDQPLSVFTADVRKILLRVGMSKAAGPDNNVY